MTQSLLSTPIHSHREASITASARPRQSWRAFAGNWAAAAVLVFSAAWLWMAHPGAWPGLAVLLLAAALLVRPGVGRRDAVIYILGAGVTVTALDYFGWRVDVSNWGGWWISAPLLAAEVLGALHTLGLQYTVWPRRGQTLADAEDPTCRPVFIFIPTVNEGPAVLEPTLRGVVAARARYLTTYPHARVTVVVCNDGRVAGAANWRDTEALAARMADVGVTCVTRTQPGGAKAGNIENARRLVGATGDALVAIFDADQIAHPDFLIRTVPLLADPSVGWVQTGQYYSNLHNPVARWANDQQGLFYRVLCPGKGALNSAFICGTNVVVRAAALDEIGGFPPDALTEDFAASIKLHSRWKSVFVSDVLTTGLGPMDLKAYFGQQRRWAIGTLSVLRSHWRDLLLPRRGGLSLPQRVQYGLACTHYLCGVRDLVYVVAPLVFLLTGLPAVVGADIQTYLWHFLPYWLLSQAAFWHVSWGKSSLRGVVIGFASFPVLTGSLASVLLGGSRKIGFTVTAKRRGNDTGLGHLWPQVLCALACVVGLIRFAGLQAEGDAAPQLLSAVWVAYALAMLGGALWLGVIDARTAADGRADAKLAWVRSVWGSSRARRVWLSAAFGTFALLVAIAATVTSYPVFGQIEPMAPSHTTALPLEGLTLPTELLGSRPRALEDRLGNHFGIIGRTQVINEHFDEAWAAQVAADGGQPWVTLLFGMAGAHRWEASLPSVVNGLHDDALRSWARAIRTYGKPVYLTILPHVDRNWAVTSAVTNGGAPSDVVPAWWRARRIFREEQANNVSWVWAPADPANDDSFAPPRDSIDLVLLSMIRFPDAEWPDPSSLLAATSAQYSDKPLLVEVSAAGAPEAKSEWLRTVGAVVAGTPHVQALLYHEGSPDPTATPAEQAAYSLASDPASLAAARDAWDMATSAAQPARADLPAGGPRYEGGLDL